MKTIAIVSQKGGAGKSTVAVALAGEAHRQGKHALIIDADPQATAANWGKRRGKEVMPIAVSVTPSLLKQKIRQADDNGFDFAFIDTAGHASRESISYSEQADLVIIPVRGSIPDTDAVAMTIALVNDFDLPHLVVVNGLRPHSRLIFKNLIEYLTDDHHANVAPVYLSLRAAYEMCFFKGKTPQEVDDDNRGKATREIAALYRCVVEALDSAVVAA